MPWWYKQSWEYNRNCNLTYNNSKKISVLVHYSDYNKKIKYLLSTFYI